MSDKRKIFFIFAFRKDRILFENYIEWTVRIIEIFY